MAKRQAGSNSKRQYERGANYMIEWAKRDCGFDWQTATAASQTAALLRYLNTDDRLCAGTVAFYIQCARVALEKLAGATADHGTTQAAIDAARKILISREGRPDHARGATLKLKEPLKAEIGDVFAYLRSKYLDGGDQIDLILALYVIVMPRIGLRPVEMSWAFWDGNSLYTPTAKRRGRPERYVPTEHWPPVFKLALGLLVRLFPRHLDDAAFETWRKMLASRLARASKHTRTSNRLSLYFARDIAIATWKQLGITPELIARLAGHAGLNSQSHYAPGRAGYGARYVFLSDAEARARFNSAITRDAPTPDAVMSTNSLGLASDNKVSGRTHSTQSDKSSKAGGGPMPVIDVDDMPQPLPPQKQDTKAAGAKLLAAARSRQDAEEKSQKQAVARIREQRGELNVKQVELNGKGARIPNSDENASGVSRGPGRGGTTSNTNS